jgi:ABC transporter DrrB family efflux protein
MEHSLGSAARTFATAHRVLQQLRRDPRTVALLLVVPCVLLALLWAVFADSPETFDSIGAPLLALFPFFSMFLVTSVATLRERTTGTLERLLTMPLAKLDLLMGYAISFGLVAVVQAVLASALALGLLGLDIAGSATLLVFVAVLDALLGVALGLCVSAFATTEFQAVQFLPAVVVPQLLVCGLFGPVDEMAPALQWFARFMPMTYAVDAMQQITAAADLNAEIVTDVTVVAVFAIGALLLGALTLRRRTP